MLFLGWGKDREFPFSPAVIPAFTMKVYRVGIPGFSRSLPYF